MSIVVVEALESLIDNPEMIYRKISSICTDGTNVNIGEKNSLWTLLEEKLKVAGSQIPLIKSWCAAHRAELAWKSATISVGKISKVLSTLSSISSYFHKSSIRSSELKRIATDRNLRLLAIPKIFEVRWSQFSFNLLRSVLVSWKTDSACAGYYKYLTNIENIKVIAFLAVVLFSFSRFQKKLQNGSLTIITMKRHVESVINTLTNIKQNILPGAFESKLASFSETGADGKIYLKGIEVISFVVSRRGTENENFIELRTKILDSLLGFLSDRFGADERLFNIVEPFIKFEKGIDLREIHAFLAPAKLGSAI